MSITVTEVLLKSRGNGERLFGYVNKPITVMGLLDMNGYELDLRPDGKLVVNGKNGDEQKMRKLLKPYFNI
ncbi:hypothetical protein D4Q76_00490 [archaeon]|nr:MAG: hypothetical protein D4Q76_00490 [archaeon]